MIKTMCFIMLCLVFVAGTTHACDVCGSSGMGIGLLTDYKSNFIRWSYNQSKFHARAQHENKVADNFSQFDLTLRCKIADKLILMARLPYGFNKRINAESTQAETSSGIADASIRLNYAIVNKKIKSKSTLYIEAGFGVVLPTGKYDNKIYDQNLPENFNIGKGAFGYTAQANAVLTKGNYGLTNNYQLLLNGKSQGAYHFGNQVAIQLMAFKEIAIKKIKWIPNTGLNYEFISVDRYQNKNAAHGTGGRGLLSTLATNFKTENWLAGFSYSIPLSGFYSDGMVRSGNRINCQVSYLF